MPDGTTKSQGLLSQLAPTLLSIAMGAIAAWGTAQFIAGQREERIRTLEYQVKELQVRQESYITRQEMKIFMDNATKDLQTIREDIRDLRNRRDK